MAKIDFLTVLESIPKSIFMIPIPIPAKNGIVTPLVGMTQQRSQLFQDTRCHRKVQQISNINESIINREDIEVVT